MVMLGRKAMMGTGSVGLAYQLRDEFLTAQAAPMLGALNSAPGPGKFIKAVDTSNNASIANGDLLIADVISDTDPAYYWTKPDGSGFTREDGLALVSYHRNGAWIGWSDSIPPEPNSLVLGAKGRDVSVAGTLWTDVLPANDVAHIIVFGANEMQHFIRYGPLEYLVFTEPLPVTTELYPAILGKVAQLESVYVYSTMPAMPLVDIPVPQTDMTFTHPESEYLIEFDVLNVSGSTNTNIFLHQQDEQNYLQLTIAPGGQPSFYRIENGVSTLVSRMGDVGDVVAGTRFVVQMRPTSLFISSSGTGTTFKAWKNGKLRSSNGTAPFQTETSGVFSSIAPGIPIANFKIWSMKP